MISPRRRHSPVHSSSAGMPVRRLRLLVAVLAPVLALGTACGTGSSAGEEPGDSPTASGSPSGGTQPGEECAYPAEGTAAKKVKAPSGTPTATAPVTLLITTDQGAIPVTLEPEQAPCTVNSFLSLADQGYFDDTVCHRLTTAGIYVLQCGDPSGTGSGGPGYRFGDELLQDDTRIQPCREQDTQVGPQEICTYAAGTLAMANAGPDTNGSQFFLVYKDSPLPNAYTVFGRMDASGLKTVQRIAQTGLAADSQGDGAPKIPVTIESVERP